MVFCICCNMFPDVCSNYNVSVKNRVPNCLNGVLKEAVGIYQIILGYDILISFHCRTKI